MPVLQPDPDSRARTHLANERTFLAWLRTGLTMMALGLAGAQLLPDGGSARGLPSLLGVIAVALGIALLLIGRSRYLRGRSQIDAGAYQPASRSVDISVALFALAGLAAMLFILVNRI